MKLKLSYKEFTALNSLLQEACLGITPKGIEAHVLHGVLFRLYKKFYTKALDVQRKYSIGIEDMEACAFYMFFSRWQPENADNYTTVLVMKLNNSIHQKFS